MSKLNHARFVVRTDGPGKERFELDGVDITHRLKGVSIELAPGCLPQVTLDPLILELDSISEGARVLVPADTADLLVQLGWKPPSELAGFPS